MEKPAKIVKAEKEEEEGEEDLFLSDKEDSRTRAHNVSWKVEYSVGILARDTRNIIRY